jgi:SAM-dependent methyltransferase
MKKDTFIAYDAYMKLAKSYAEIVDIKPHNAEYERPGLLHIMPDVQGKKVLDAGCGSGSLTHWLLEHGAEVIGVDASPEMLKYATLRIGDKATLRLHDLREPLGFLQDESLDLVVSSLVMHYLDELLPVFREFYRILKPCGHFVFSIQHPFTEFVNRPSDNYYDAISISYDWTGFTEKPVSVPCYRRPLQDYTEALSRSGFYIQRLTEPVPTEKFKEQMPESYNRHFKNPMFMVIRAWKPESSP